MTAVPRRRSRLAAAFAALGVAAGCAGAAAPAPALTVTTMATGLQVPWGLAFLPGGDALVSERGTGRILRIPRRGGRARTVMRIGGLDPQRLEGGLLGLAVSPRYARDRLVYAFVTTATDNRVVRFRLGGATHPVLTGIARGRYHDGGRIAFGPDGRLYATVGDATRGSNAQDPASPNGKILRMNPDGSVPRDNPFPGSLVFSLGHRNVQGLAWDAAGRLWASELGEKAYDEVNLIRPGANYGWPAVEGPGDTRGGTFTNPALTWSPTSTSSPSGVAVAGSTLYVAALQCGCLWRIPLHGTTTGAPAQLLAGRFGRLRTVERAPDGALWVTTSNRDGRGVVHAGDDRVLRVRP
jgi:glucose/arabinose dehydrogenase